MIMSSASARLPDIFFLAFVAFWVFVFATVLNLFLFISSHTNAGGAPRRQRTYCAARTVAIANKPISEICLRRTNSLVPGKHLRLVLVILSYHWSQLANSMDGELDPGIAKP